MHLYILVLLLFLLSASAHAQVPVDPRAVLKPDLVELIKIIPDIHLDITYASTNNAFHTVFYPEARAFLQRPAALALQRAHQKLKQKGYGLLVYDGYRPFKVTQQFWNLTPDSNKRFVANPKEGSRHNRGCAVDISLYDLKTGKPVVMPSNYDEMSLRAYPNYTGGSTESRALRDLLRQTLEAEGFTVYLYEWWHFDFKNWEMYPVMDIPFSEIKE